MGSTSDTVRAMADRKRQKAPPREKPQQIADECAPLIVGASSPRATLSATSPTSVAPVGRGGVTRVAVAQSDGARDSISTRRRGIESQRRLAELIEAGKGPDAEAHWRSHMAVVGKVVLGRRATTVIDLFDHY